MYSDFIAFVNLNLSTDILLYSPYPPTKKNIATYNLEIAPRFNKYPF